MSTDEIVGWNAVTLSRRIHNRDVSCVEVLNAYTQQIDRLNPLVNAIVNRQSPESLYAAASHLDEQLQKGADLGPMHGFPQAPKDAMPAKGMITSQGSSLFKDRLSDTDATVYQRMRHGGSIFIGRSNSPEFALSGHTYNDVYGTTTNAFDTTRSAGGSSGGAGVAVALHMLPVADGTDMMGSLRTPAAFNNVFGLRPSFGCIPHGPTDELFLQQFSVTGAIARTVPDLALILSVQAGYDIQLPSSRKQDDSALFSQALERDMNTTRVAWLGDLDGRLATDPGLMDVYANALPHFDTIGCDVQAVNLDTDMDLLWQAWQTLRSFTIAGNSASLYQDTNTRKRLKPELIWEIENGLALSASDVFEASRVRSAFYRTLVSLFQHYDYLLMPSAQVFPFPADMHWPSEINGVRMDTYHRWMETVMLATLGGLPALSVPAGFSATGLPAGLQIIGRPQADISVLQLGHAYDVASGFSRHKSPLL